MSRPYSPGAAKFVDCQQHGPGSGAELILVEGDSALSSVVAVRDVRTQGVLALQGKPLNAQVATAARVAAHGHYHLLAQALGLATAAPTPVQAAACGPGHSRFERLTLLFDPDADGIHIGALVVLYLQRWLPQWLLAGRVDLVRAPMFELVCAGDGEVHFAHHPAQCQELTAQLRARAEGQALRVQAFRGLGSLSPAVLRERCVQPATRHGHALTPADVQAVQQVFGRRVNGA